MRYVLHVPMQLRIITLDWRIPTPNNYSSGPTSQVFPTAVSCTRGDTGATPSLALPLPHPIPDAALRVQTGSVRSVISTAAFVWCRFDSLSRSLPFTLMNDRFKLADSHRPRIAPWFVKHFFIPEVHCVCWVMHQILCVFYLSKDRIFD